LGGIDSLTVLSFAGLVVAIILHEISHGVVALWFGDDTAKRAGRLTLNPVPHIDPFGSIILPALGALSGLPILGWAKPVPVNPMKLRDRRRHMLLVALAGPATNLVLMAIAAVVARELIAGQTWSDVDDLSFPAQAALIFAVVNLFLGLFNLLPIPPLDGSALLERMLPARYLPMWHRIRPYGFIVLFLLVFSTGLVGHVLEPFMRRLGDFVDG
jgi:Zn-dependent protease